LCLFLIFFFFLSINSRQGVLLSALENLSETVPVSLYVLLLHVHVIRSPRADAADDGG
jgi:hypothetical protein